MKTKLILLALFIFITQDVFTQNIVVKNNIASIDGKKYIKVVKENRHNYIIKDVITDNEILKVSIRKVYHRSTNKRFRLPNVFFLDLNKNMGFENVDIRNEYDLIKFLYERKLVFLNGDVNTELVMKFFKKREEKSDFYLK